MDTTALTFRASPDFIDAIRAYADRLGMTVNGALREIIAPVVGYSANARLSSRPRNDLARFCGRLKRVDCHRLEATQGDFSKIEPEMWK